MDNTTRVRRWRIGNRVFSLRLSWNPKAKWSLRGDRHRWGWMTPFGYLKSKSVRGVLMEDKHRTPRCEHGFEQGHTWTDGSTAWCPGGVE